MDVRSRHRDRERSTRDEVPRRSRSPRRRRSRSRSPAQVKTDAKSSRFYDTHGMRDRGGRQGGGREDSRDMKARPNERDRNRSKEDDGKVRRRDKSRSRSKGRDRSRSKSKPKKEKADKSKKRKEVVKKSKSKTRSRSASSTSSGSSDGSSSNSSEDSFKLLMKLEQERKHQLEETKKRKEMTKAMETPEEKRLRRLAKKDAKERKRKERMGWDNEYLHYTNVDNPFGDHNLLDTFMWKKKLQKEGLTDISREEVERINRLKQEENKLELEKVKKRRLERERERAQRDEEEALIQRQKEAEQFKEWGNQEDVFHLEQATLRSKIRIKDGRAKPIDLLAQYISAEEEVDAVEMHEPYTYLNGLTVQDLEDLIEDIHVYKQLERGKNLSYWADITVIVEDELRKLKKLEQDDDYRVALERREGINPSVAADVAAIFRGKSAEQLQALKTQIKSKLDGSTSGVDISYWESLLSQLKAHIARAQLRDRHQENLRRKLALLKAEQGVELSTGQDSPIPSTSKGITEVKDESEMDQNPTIKVKSEETLVEEDEGSEEYEPDIIDECIQKYKQGSYSPRIITSEAIEPGIFVIGEDEDNARLELARSQVLAVPGKKVENVWTAEEKALQHEAKKGMGEDEATFAVETSMADQVYLWSDKYRPRKPRYFNRVHTGFEWNKYNQTHYDMDNPPPKIVQGYKFNIFFPDLIDKNTTPQYYLTACKENPDFAILRFSAGPPYEDIAFKIVNREWEYSYKRGFRCQFHNNIFQLWFHFKRYRYRR